MAKETINIEVKSDISKLTKQVVDLQKEIKALKGDTKKFGDGVEKTTKTGKTGLKGMSLAAKGVGTAMKAMGIGLIIAAFMALWDALKSNKVIAEGLEKVMNFVSNAFKIVVDVLVDTYKWVTESSDRFDALKIVMTSLMTLALTPLKLSFYTIKLAIQAAMLVWNEWFDSDNKARIDEIKAGMQETAAAINEVRDAAIDAAIAIKDNIVEAINEVGAIATHVVDGIKKADFAAGFAATKKKKRSRGASTDADVEAVAIQGIIDKFERLAAIQAQMRDDDTKTFAERMAASKEYGAILDKQGEQILLLENRKVEAAEKAFNRRKGNQQLEAAYLEALNSRANVEENVANAKKEQQLAEIALQKEMLELQKEMDESRLTGIDKEMAELRTAHEEKLEMARQLGMDSLLIEEQYILDKQELIDRYAEEQAEIDAENEATRLAELQALADKEREIAEINAQKIADFKQRAYSDTVSALNSSLKAAGNDLEKNYKKELKMAGSNEDAVFAVEQKYKKEREALAEKQKKIQVAQAMISMYQSVIEAFRAGASLPGPLGIVGGPVAAVLALAAGLANIKAIMSSDVGGGGGGAPPPAPPEVQESMPSEDMMSGGFAVEDQAAPEPLQAYVVTDDITQGQNALAAIRRRSTI